MTEPTGIETRQMKGAVRNLLFGEESDPIKIGRFKVLSKIGAGGMGVVYSAYDEELDRKVAIKLLLADLQGGSEGRARLKREAQAMAKLAHPNVVTVHEVGEHDGQVFVAMEFVKGQTLRAWMDDDHDWRETLDVFIQAGRGLAAAHEAGIVHRDFKPENVLVGEDGRARVLDFGLATPARPELVEGRTQPNGRSSTGSGRTEEESLTQTGAVMGTPAYMSPEQHEGKPPDARSDQFSFCVALWEAMFGERPFEGETREELVAAVSKRQVRSVHRGSVPARIHTALLRGLSTNRDARHPDMPTVIRELVRAGRKRSRAAVVAGAVAVLSIGGMAATWATTRAPSEPCKDPDAKIAAVWNDDARATVRAVLTQIEMPDATEFATSYEREIDEYVATWKQAYEQSCAALANPGETPAELPPLQLACLDFRLTNLWAFLSAFDEVTGTEEWTSGLRTETLVKPAERCLDERIARTQVRLPDDPDLRAKVLQVRRDLELGLLMMERFEGREEEGLELTEAAGAVAATLDYEPIAAFAAWYVGWGHYVQGDPGALEEIDAAVQRLEIARYDEAAAQALGDLMTMAAFQFADFASAHRYGDRAEAIYERIGGDVERLRWLRLRRSEIYWAQNHYDPSVRQIERALELGGTWERQQLYARTAMLQGWRGHLEAARAAVDRGLEVARQRPTLQGRRAAAATLRSWLAMVEHKAGRPQEALEQARAALVDLDDPELIDAPFHAPREQAHATAAGCLIELGRHEEAERELEIVERRARNLDREVLPLVSHALRGAALLEIGQLSEARTELRRAEAFIVGHDSLALRAGWRVPLGVARAETGAGRDAIATLETAIAELDECCPRTVDQGIARYALARALTDAGDARAPEMIIAARKKLGEHDTPRAKAWLARLEAWAAAGGGHE